MLTKIDQLWIRACKAEDYSKRLRSVYRRFYLSTSNEESIKAYIAHILAGIIDRELKGLSATSVLSLNDGMFNEGLSLRGRIMDLLIREIRYQKADDLRKIGHTIPKRFR